MHISALYCENYSKIYTVSLDLHYEIGHWSLFIRVGLQLWSNCTVTAYSNIFMHNKLSKLSYAILGTRQLRYNNK